MMLLLRTSVTLLATFGGLLVGATAGGAEDCAIVGGEVVVTACALTGSLPAIPDDGHDDTAAINHAISVVHAAGGGSVVFPPGTYDAAGIVHRSGVRLAGPDTAVPTATIKRIWSSDVDLISGEVSVLYGSIPAWSKSFTVTNASNVHVGDQVAIRGAEYPSSNQYTTLAMPLLSGTGQLMMVQNGYGFNPGGGFLRVGNEIIEYQPVSAGSNTFRTITRNMYGTTAPAMHSYGTGVHQLRDLYAEVTAVNGKVVTLDRPAKFGVSNARAFVGSADMTVEDLELDGNRPAPVGPASPLNYMLARNVRISDCVIRNATHGGVHFQGGTNRSIVEDSTFTDIGSPSGVGADIWIFQSAHTNTIRNNRFVNTDPLGGGSNAGVFLDDRTTGSSEWDGDVHHNIIEGNRIELHDADQRATTAIGIAGGTYNIVRNNLINIGSGTTTADGIRLLTDGQGSHPIVSQRNTVTGNQLSGHSRALWTQGANNNTISGNTVTNSWLNCYDQGKGNTGVNTTDDGPCVFSSAAAPTSLFAPSGGGSLGLLGL